MQKIKDCFQLAAMLGFLTVIVTVGLPILLFVGFWIVAAALWLLGNLDIPTKFF